MPHLAGDLGNIYNKKQMGHVLYSNGGDKTSARPHGKNNDILLREPFMGDTVMLPGIYDHKMKYGVWNSQDCSITVLCPIKAVMILNIFDVMFMGMLA